MLKVFCFNRIRCLHLEADNRSVLLSKDVYLAPPLPPMIKPPLTHLMREGFPHFIENEIFEQAAECGGIRANIEALGVHTPQSRDDPSIHKMGFWLAYVALGLSGGPRRQSSQ